MTPDGDARRGECRTDIQAQQVIGQRDRTDKGVVFLWTGSRDAKAGLAQLKGARAYAQQARITGVSVQEMAGEGVEVIIGVNCDRNWARCCCSAAAA
jgi:hypothetical protein